MARGAAKEHRLDGGVQVVALAQPPRARCACTWEGPVTEWTGPDHAARLPEVPIPPLEHRVTQTDTISTLSGPSTRLTCSCGWFGHTNRWMGLSHAALIPGTAIPPLPATAPQPASASERRRRHEELRAAIYGERRDRGRGW